MFTWEKDPLRPRTSDTSGKRVKWYVLRVKVHSVGRNEQTYYLKDNRAGANTSLASALDFF